ncbi:PIN domain-containing protein [Nonomuraea insulae]|uniref:PIN domain-containing protein n=1 Tax=Nonomuraea insulae TaxID=1616787 RepID=A0ABW1CVJ9_9ACTN
MNELSMRKICVLIDTNIWRSETLLRTPLGVALLYAVRQNDAKLGMPEVIKREIKKQILQSGMEAFDRMVKSGRLLQRLLNSSVDPLLSSRSPERKIEQAIQDRLIELQPLMIHVPLTLDHVRRALDRVDAGLPPSGGRKQQYKDCLIWEAARDLATDYVVYIVSQDAAFFENKSLAKALFRECSQEGFEIKAFPSLQDVLVDLAPAVPNIDRDALSRLVAAEALSSATAMLKSLRGFTLGDLLNLDVKVFGTEDPSRLSATFEAAYNLSGSPQDPKYGYVDAVFNASLKVSGSFTLIPASDQLLDFIGYHGVFSWAGPDGISREMYTILTSSGKSTLTIGPAIRAMPDGASFDFATNVINVLDEG